MGLPNCSSLAQSPLRPSATHHGRPARLRPARGRCSRAGPPSESATLCGVDTLARRYRRSSRSSAWTMQLGAQADRAPHARRSRFRGTRESISLPPRRPRRHPPTRRLHGSGARQPAHVTSLSCTWRSRSRRRVSIGMAYARPLSASVWRAAPSAALSAALAALLRACCSWCAWLMRATHMTRSSPSRCSCHAHHEPHDPVIPLAHAHPPRADA
jgi:hypothetical protein